ncbi:MAG: hypothetical protein ACLRP3_04730 [Escherichia sp.]
MAKSPATFSAVSASNPRRTALYLRVDKAPADVVSSICIVRLKALAPITNGARDMLSMPPATIN